MAVNPKSFLYAVDPATAVATITLNRPERLNALTFEVYTELRDTFRALDTEPGVRAIIITGTGRAFCSGGDVEDIIGALFSRDAAGLLEFTRLTGDLILSIRQCRRPVVAALNGTVAGAGRRDRGGQRHPDRGRERQDRLSLFARGARRCRHGCRVAPAPHRRPGARERAPHAGRLHHAPSAPPQIGLYNRVVPGERLMAEATEVAVPAGAGPVGGARRHQAGAQPGGRDGSGLRDRVGGPGPGRLHAESQLPRGVRSVPRQARAEVRVAHARHPTDPNLSRAAPHGARRAGRRLCHGRDRPARRSRRTTPPRGGRRGPCSAARCGRLAPADPRPRSPRVLPHA